MSTADERAVTQPEYRLPAGRIAILLAAYNGARYLEEQLESIRRQTYADFVCFIHDDGSTDGTQEIASAWCSRHPEQFVCLGSSRTGGSKYNFMYMLHKAEADYVMFCDQDDVWLPEKIEKTWRAMRQAEEMPEQTDTRPAPLPVCVFSDLRVVDADLQVMNQSFFAYSSIHPQQTSLRQLLYNNVAPGCTMMINAPLRQLMLAADVTDRIFMHDWLAMLLAAAVGKIVFLDEALICYRQHGDNVVGASQKRSLRQKMEKLQLVEWFEKKRAYLAGRQENAKAVLLCLEAGCREEAGRAYDAAREGANSETNTAAAATEKISAAKKEIRCYIRRLNGPFPVKLVRFYAAKWSGR